MRRLLLLVAAAALLACGPTIPTVERPAVITVVYDPSTGNVPAPNDLALTDGVVAIAPNPALSDAENALKATMNGKDGFSLASSVRVQFSAPISAASLSSATVVAFDLGEGGKGPVEEASVARAWADCDRAVTMTAPAGFLPKHTYLFAVRGGAGGVRGAADEPIEPSPAFYFLRAGKDLRDHPDALPGATRSDKRATAEALEAVRQKLEPHFAVLEAHGVPRREVAALWTFTVRTSTDALQDPGSKRVPFPNDLLKDAATGLVSLPADPADSASQASLKRAFNQLDGFSTTAALSVELSAPAERATVTAQTVRLFQQDGAREFLDVDRTLSADAKKVVLQPRTPLLPGTRYVVVLAGVKDSAGALVAPTPLSSVLSLAQPLVTAQGESALSVFCADTAKQLEPTRAAISSVLEAALVSRTQLNVAWAFTTQDILGRAQELWRAPYVQGLPLAVTDARLDNPPLTHLNTAKVLTGRFQTFDRLDPVTRAFRPNGQGEPRAIDFMLTLPKGVAAGGTVRVVVFGHGLNTERRLMLLVADRLARAGFATMAIDFPYHGERTVCLKDADCSSGATCAVDGVCLKAGVKVDFARLPAIPGVPGEGWASATGAAWIDIEDLAATRDHFRQAMLDLSAQTRMIRLYDWRQVTGGIALDATDAKYAGISLGGIMGSAVSGVDPAYGAMLLNVAGAGLPDLMRESATFGPTLRDGLAAKGIVEGTPAYDAFIGAARWILDEVDPINLSPYALKRPLQYRNPLAGDALVTAPLKKLRLQMALGDTVVPNSSTRRLVTATGVTEATMFREFIGSHGFLANPTEPIAMTQGQDDMARFLENN